MIMGLGKRIKDLREKSGMTQKQLAAHARVSRSAISYYESCDRAPTLDALIKISKSLRVSTDYLLGVDNIKRMDLSGLTEKDIEIVEMLVKSMREKNEK